MCCDLLLVTFDVYFCCNFLSITHLEMICFIYSTIKLVFNNTFSGYSLSIYFLNNFVYFNEEKKEEIWLSPVKSPYANRKFKNAKTQCSQNATNHSKTTAELSHTCSWPWGGYSWNTKKCSYLRYIYIYMYIKKDQ